MMDVFIDLTENQIFRIIKNNKIHPAIMLMKKQYYWDIGGCDEDWLVIMDIQIHYLNIY